MRQLCGEDIFLLSMVIDEMNLTLPKVPKLEKKLMTNEEYKIAIEEAQKNYGTEIMLLLVRNMHKAKHSISLLLASLYGKDVKDLTMSEILTGFKEVISSEDFASFFK